MTAHKPSARYALCKRLLGISVLTVFCCTVPASESGAWFLRKSDQEYLAEALRSTNPKKVEACLDRQIQHKNFPGILKIRKHARDMIRAEQNKRNTARGIAPEQLKRTIAPWMRIEKKATEFYKQSVH